MLRGPPGRAAFARCGEKAQLRYVAPCECDHDATTAPRARSCSLVKRADHDAQEAPLEQGFRLRGDARL